MSAIRALQDQLFFKLCSDHLSIEAIPRKRVNIDLNAIKSRGLGEHEIILWTPYFVVLENSVGIEVTVRKDGRMIIRKAGSEEDAHKAASDVLAQLSNFKR